MSSSGRRRPGVPGGDGHARGGSAPRAGSRRRGRSVRVRRPAWPRASGRWTLRAGRGTPALRTPRQGPARALHLATGWVPPRVARSCGRPCPSLSGPDRTGPPRSTRGVRAPPVRSGRDRDRPRQGPRAAGTPNRTPLARGPRRPALADRPASPRPDPRCLARGAPNCPWRRGRSRLGGRWPHPWRVPPEPVRAHRRTRTPRWRRTQGLPGRDRLPRRPLSLTPPRRRALPGPDRGPQRPLPPAPRWTPELDPLPRPPSSSPRRRTPGPLPPWSSARTPPRSGRTGWLPRPR